MFSLGCWMLVGCCLFAYIHICMDVRLHFEGDQHMKMSYKRESAEPTAKETEGLEGLAGRSVDTSDLPEQLDWSGAVRGKFYRPVKHRSGC